MVKMNAQVALALMGKAGDSAIPGLINALGSKEDPTSMGAGLALTLIGRQSPEKLLPGLTVALYSNEEPLVSNTLKVFRGMKNHGPKILPQLVDMYDKVDSKKRQLVLRTVAELDTKGDQALPLCMKGLADPNPATRKEALTGALRYRSRLGAFLEPLIEALRDQDEENRLLAIGIVKGFGDKATEAIPNLIALGKEGTARVRVSAISSLGVFASQSDDVVRVLETALGDTDEKVKMAALGALRTAGQRNPEPVIPILERALKSEKEQKTKRSIVAALDSIKKTEQGMGNR
jgi:HEAT repeat protein